ncbi:MAG: dynamin family protein, partial [Deltaproteobacteria bacterium]|nr:dynamin family protein [Deltaproteobacteria bacterium]
MALDELTKTKDNLVAELEALSEIAAASGAPSLKERLLSDRLPRLREERMVLVVLGEFNHGKSTFVNALLGSSVLPSGITPTTALIHEVRWGKEPRAELVFRKKELGDQINPIRIAAGERREVRWERLSEMVVGGEIIADDVLRVELEHPASILENKVTLVDTPGVNDLNQQRAEITYGYVPRADAVVFLLDAGQILKDSERRFLRDKLLGAGRDRIVFAINKSDILDQTEREQVLAYAKKQIGQLVPGAPTLLISAENELAGKSDSSGFAELRTRLDELLGDNRLRMLVDYGADEGLRVSSLLLRGLEVRRRALSMTRDELSDRLSALERDLAGSKEAVASRHKRIAEEIGAIRAMARRDLVSFAEEFALSIPGQIEQQSADDVRRFLSNFIEDTWKKWLEREGALLGEKLERLAEDIVAIVQEDARETNKKLEGFLGEGASTLDVKVDTVGYDVGVFALGAFGVGVMMLSNLLVGGLLTIAAPVLAMLFKDRVDKEIKAKALQNAPDVVRTVARKVEPELLAAIDRFGEKLSDFVTNASEELRRSLIEILTDTKRMLAVESMDKG